MCDEHGNLLALGAKELMDVKTRNNPPKGTEVIPRVHTGQGLLMPLSRAHIMPQGTPGRILTEEGIAIVLVRLKRGSKADRIVAKVWHPGPVLSCPPPERSHNIHGHPVSSLQRWWMVDP